MAILSERSRQPEQSPAGLRIVVDPRLLMRLLEASRDRGNNFSAGFHALVERGADRDTRIPVEAAEGIKLDIVPLPETSAILESRRLRLEGSIDGGENLELTALRLLIRGVEVEDFDDKEAKERKGVDSNKGKANPERGRTPLGGRTGVPMTGHSMFKDHFGSSLYPQDDGLRLDL